jgi:hypothetical protein
MVRCERRESARFTQLWLSCPPSTADARSRFPRLPAVCTAEPRCAGCTGLSDVAVPAATVNAHGDKTDHDGASAAAVEIVGIAVTRSRDAAGSHLPGRSGGDGGCGRGPLAGYRLARRRREITSGRRSDGAPCPAARRQSDRAGRDGRTQAGAPPSPHGSIELRPATMFRAAA